MRAVWIIGAVGLLAACPSGGPTDHPDGPPVDTVTGDNRLSITFTTDQDVPGMTAVDRTLSEVRFHADSVRAIGDAAPGDARTTQSDYVMRWHETTQPAEIQFDQAPAGVYSSVEVRLEQGLGDDNHAVLIQGEVLLEAVWKPYQIESNTPLTITIATSTTLPPGGSETIASAVDLAGIIAGIDFGPLQTPEDTIEINDDDVDLMAAIRTAIRAAFTAPVQD